VTEIFCTVHINVSQSTKILKTKVTLILSHHYSDHVHLLTAHTCAAPAVNKLNLNIETVSCPWNTSFWYAWALAEEIRHSTRISYNQCESVSKTCIAWARDCFYFYC